MNKELYFFVLALGLALAACASPSAKTPTLGPEPNVQNGERIYFTDESGRSGSITYTSGPDFGGMMMGSYLTCAACHGPGGHGGSHLMPMTIMNAPDITLPALNVMPEMKSANSSYNLADFKMAVEGGLDPAGKELNSNMPRWSMSDADLQDLFAFVKTLQ